MPSRSVPQPGASGLDSGSGVFPRRPIRKQTVPKASTIAFLFDPAGVVWRKELESAADTLGVTLRFTEFRSPDALEDVFVGLGKARVAAVLVSGNSLEYVHRHRIIELAARHRLPAVYMWSQAVADGGLMSYGPDFGYLAYRAATYVDKILMGAKPADVPVEQPTKVKLVINLKTAKALGSRSRRRYCSGRIR